MLFGGYVNLTNYITMVNKMKLKEQLKKFQDSIISNKDEDMIMVVDGKEGAGMSCVTCIRG